MRKINDGGPAFPIEGNFPRERGMSIRDYFAAVALNGILSRQLTGALGESHSDRAHDAYKYADAMLKARESTDE